MLMLTCLAMACCLLAYIALMKHTNKKRKNKIKRIQKTLREIDKKKKEAEESRDDFTSP